MIMKFGGPRVLRAQAWQRLVLLKLQRRIGAKWHFTDKSYVKTVKYSLWGCLDRFAEPRKRRAKSYGESRMAISGVV
jgi:hypothetical protein